jgi:hypothetical protein
MLVLPIKDVMTLGVGGVKVLNGDVAGLRANAALTLKGIPEFYMDLFVLGSPATRQIILQDLTAGLKFNF